MENMASAIEHQRRTLKELQQIILNFDSKSKAEQTRGLVKSFIEEVDNICKEFKENHESLCLYVDENALQEKDIPYFNDDVFYAFKDLYLTFKGKLLEISTDNQAVNSPPPHASTFRVPSNLHNESVSTDARLPKIQLPSFSGDYLAWIYYRDMFLSLVHNNNGLSNVQKYYFLQGSCQGTPKDIVNEYPASDASYDLAWSALNLRYHNKKMIVEALLGKLFSIPNTNGSFESIQVLLDTTRKCLALLRTMKINVDCWDAILVFLTVNKLDTQSRKEWERSLKASTEIPSMKDFLSFLETTFRTLESVDKLPIANSDSVSSVEKIKKPFINNRRPSYRNVHVSAINDDFNCPCCEKRHLLYKCFKFAALPTAARRDLINSKGICRNCLNTGHFHSDCPLSSRCHLCHQPHHTIVHNDFSAYSYNSRPTTSTNGLRTGLSPELTSSVNQITSSNDESKNFACNLSAFDSISSPQVLLATIRVLVKSKGETFFLRALLDQAAQGTFITEDAVQTLELQKCNTYAKISGVAGKLPLIARNFVSLDVNSLYENNFNLKCNAYVLPSITSYQPLPVNKSIASGLENLFLADPYFAESGQIDLLLGGDVYGEIILPEHKRYNNSILLQLSHFGWIVSGPTSKMSYSRVINVNVCALNGMLRSFWEQEELLEKRYFTAEETACEKHFETTHTRATSGRYTVSLPFKSMLCGYPQPTFNGTDYSALRRLKHLEAKLKQNPLFGAEYCKFMEEYEALGHMKRVGTYPNDLERNSYFLPHHGVFRESSSTTKLRVVFDGSSKTPHCSSLNEELSSGPALQNDLPTIITRWRRFKIGFRSDLEKMFRQIQVIPEEQNYQQILWRDPITKKILIYKLCTVTYGTTSAPYLSIKVLQQLAEDEKESYPEACKVLLSDTYVDDVISGADTISDAKRLQVQLCQLLKAGCFNLRKWISNSSELLNSIPTEYKEITNKYQFDDQNTVVKALGLEWDTTSDVFQFKINFDECLTVTKRKLLSDAAKLYDPLGWLAPTTILAKITFQKLWLAGLDWNDPLPEDLRKEWLHYRNNLKELESIKIPRWIGSFETSRLEVHGFCDASQLAFAAVVYVKVIDSEGKGPVTLLQSKTKVAPLKTLSIPRLELCGALLLVKLIQKICLQLDRNIQQIVYWTDSSTVLSWIRGQPSKWSVYVGNRVAEIQRNSDIYQWKHVSSLFNPADCASRGITSKELKNHPLWWGGPSWLSKPSSSWPKQPSFTTELELKKTELSINVSICNKIIEYPSFFKKYSSLIKLVRITAFIFRFKHNSMSEFNKTERKLGFLKTSEMQHALNHLIRLGQSFEFEDELSLLRNGTLGKSNNGIVSLCPFIDQDGILRVGGRLQNSNLGFSLKHPILLTKRNPLSALIFRDAHVLTLHGGLQQMLSYAARKYWIVSARNLAKSVQSKCITCFKYNASAAQQIMGNLPPVRLQPTRPFKHSGVDYAGPITIKQSTARNSITTKGYICLFICMVTKALHLEAVTTLSTESFLAAFKRFVSRRGICTDVYSDCGTNFVGANKELQILNHRSKSTLPEELVEMLANTGTTWHFIPPASPNFGGLWEAGVKSTKYHLRRIMQNRILTYEELSTLLSQIESCLNSRPLCPLSTDPLDCNALTPSHFLIGEPSLCIPEEDLLDYNIDRLSRWKVVERLKQQFWRRWANECLNRLQARPKWLKINRNAQVGDLVLIIDERCPPGQWPLGRVQQVHPGLDGYIRVVTILSKGKSFKRPISKLAFLPINQEETTEDLEDTRVPSSSDDQLAVSRSTARSTRRPNQTTTNESD